jgi:hypothetical protein
VVENELEYSHQQMMVYMMTFLQNFRRFIKGLPARCTHSLINKKYKTAILAYSYKYLKKKKYQNDFVEIPLRQHSRRHSLSLDWVNHPL